MNELQSNWLRLLDAAGLGGGEVAFDSAAGASRLRCRLGHVVLHLNHHRDDTALYLSGQGGRSFLLDDVGVVLGWWTLEATQARAVPFELTRALAQIAAELAALQSLFDPAGLETAEARLSEAQRRRVALRYG